jgi:hypothetical protein
LNSQFLVTEVEAVIGAIAAKAASFALSSRLRSAQTGMNPDKVATTGKDSSSELETGILINLGKALFSRSACIDVFVLQTRYTCCVEP